MFMQPLLLCNRLSFLAAVGYCARTTIILLSVFATPQLVGQTASSSIASTDRLADAKTLAGQGLKASERGDLPSAEEYFKQALAIYQELDSGSIDMATCKNGAGKVASDRGDLAKAEAYYLEALRILRIQALRGPVMADVLGNLGTVASDRGDMAKAREYYRRSLDIEQKLDPRSLAVAQNLTNLGNVEFNLGDFANARKHYMAAIKIEEELDPGNLAEAHSLNKLGNLADRRGYPAQAEKYYRHALAIAEKRAPGTLPEAYSLSNLGTLENHRGDLAKAAEYYRKAVEIEGKLAPNSARYAKSLAGLAGSLRDEGRPGEAVKLYAEAIDVLDRQLEHLGGSDEVRAGFRAQHENTYSKYIDLLLTQKKPELAFQVMERSRARTLLETLAKGHIDIRQGADPKLIQRERSLQEKLTTTTNRRINLLEVEHTEEQLASVNKVIAGLLAQYKELEGQIRFSSPKYASLTQPIPLTASEVQEQLLDADTVLLDYFLGIKHSFVFVVTPRSLGSYELPERSEIESTARQVYDLLKSPRRVKGETSDERRARLVKEGAEYEKTSAALSQMILGPVAKQLESKRLLIVADGALHYIPFGVLPAPANDKTKPAVLLIAEHEIVNLPSASVLALLRHQVEERGIKPSKEVAVLADPVFDDSDPRVRKSPVIPAAKTVSEPPRPSAGDHLTDSLKDVIGAWQEGVRLPRLAFSRREAAAIMAMTKPEDSMVALDFQASRETAMSKELSQYRIVHFATHGLLDSEHPELSGLVLSMVGPDGATRNGFLGPQDIYNLTLPADLVGLSACETGLGKEVSGEGLVGLTRGFMYAGASRVVASLWQVDDAATSELMGAFYKAMLKDGLRPAAALRQAQMELMKQKRWHDPYYWAAFTLQGEWK